MGTSVAPSPGENFPTLDLAQRLASLKAKQGYHKAPVGEIEEANSSHSSKPY
jgi:hypothetical protein